MSRFFVRICDFCQKEIGRTSNILDRVPAYNITCQISKPHKGQHEFEVLMCESCWDQMIDPSPRGIIKRLAGFFSKFF